MNHRSNLRWAIVTVGCLALLAPDLAYGQLEQTFTGATNNDYNLDSNWVGASGMLVPDVTMAEEFAAIGSNTPDPLTSDTFPLATANITGVVPPVGRMLIGFGVGTEGTLNVGASGDLLVIPTLGGLAGDVVVGANGTGTLNISSTGLVIAELLDVRSTGTARVAGPNAVISVDALEVEGVLVADITNASSHSVIDVASDSTISGQLAVDLSSISSPSAGDSWEIVESGTVSGSFSSVNLIGTTPLGSTQVLNTRNVNNGATTSIEVFVEQLLSLQVDRSTGDLSIINTGAASAANNVAIDGYTISSTSGLLNTNWDSLDDQNVGGGDWLEANPTAERLSELQESSSTTVVASGASLTLANGYVAPSEFGVGGDLEFQYTRPDGAISTGVVEYTGPANTIVLQIDPATGEARMINQSQFSVDIDGYTITSADDALLTSWNSLDDQNTGGGDWLEANPDAGRLSELKEAGALTLNNGTQFDLGLLYNVGLGSGEGDVVFEFLINDGVGGESTSSVGEVLFATLAAGLQGDFNNDGTVDLADYTVWRNNLGANESVLPPGTGNDSGTVDVGDYNVWKGNFGATSGLEAISSSTVPEPTSVCLLGLAIGSMISRRYFHRSQTMEFCSSVSPLSFSLRRFV